MVKLTSHRRRDYLRGVIRSYVLPDSLPDGEERAALQIAGLGEKIISLSAFADAQEIYQGLLFHFPKLCDAGGFELLRIPEGGGKQLYVIAAPEGDISESSG